MADTKNTLNGVEVDTSDVSEMQDILRADHYGMSTAFFKSNRDRNEKILDQIRNVSNKLNHGSTNQMEKTLHTLNDITRLSTDTRRQHFDMLDTINNSSGGGFRQVSAGIEQRNESEIISFGNSLFGPYRSLVSEYRGVVRLIPEIKRCVRMISRDIMSTNEITKRSIFNVYKSTVKETADEKEKTTIETVNNYINDIITDLDLENKVHSWIEDSLVEGAKPVYIIPYRDIVEMMNINNINSNISRESMSVESILETDNDYHKLIPKDFFSLLHFSDNSTESTFSEKKDDKSIEAVKVHNLVTDLIGEELSQEYYKESSRLLTSVLGKQKVDEIFDVPKNLRDEQHKNHNPKYDQIIEQAAAKPNMQNLFDAELLSVIKNIDEAIDVYDDDSSPIALAVDASRAILKHRAYHEDKSLGMISYGPRSRSYDGPEIPTGAKSSVNDQFDIFSDKTKNGNTVSEKDGFKSIFDVLSDNDSKDFLNNCLIKEADSEDVIPIIVSGEHVGYYVMELSPYTGNVESVNKSNSNFTDMFLNMGFNNDNALTPYYGGMTAFSSGISTPQAYGSGMGGEIPNLNNSGIGFGGSNMLNDVNTGYADPEKRNATLKKIMYQLINKKIKNKDIENDENFKSAVMNILRDGNIIHNKVRFTYVPSKYMVYFTPKLDGNGIPVSILKDILFTCYLYISSIMTSALIKITKSSVRDKITVNIGNAKNLGMSIRSIENSLSTKRINVESGFTSLARVLKLSSTSETLIEPVYNGEKIYDLSQMERMNDISADDTYTEKLLNTIITGLNSPLSIMSGDMSEDLASVHMSRNAEYRSGIIQRQAPYGKQTTKLLRLILVSKGIIKKFSRDDGERFDIKDVELVFSPPEYLNMKNTNDMFSMVDSYADNIIKTYYDDSEDSTLSNISKSNFKRSIYRKFIPGLDWDEFDSMYEASKNATITEATDMKTQKAISEQIDNEEIDFNKGEDGYSEGSGDDMDMGGGGDGFSDFT